MGTMPDPEIKEDLRREDLVYTTDARDGYFRQRIGKSLAYYDTDGKRIKDKDTLSRIKNLAIPPAWRNVWVTPKANGHLQATGFDNRGRKQYLYHPDWLKISKANKFDKMIDFGLKLPKIREKIRFDLRAHDLDKKKVIATIVWLLERTFIRIGNEEYSRENNSFGLTTLRNRHVKIRGSDIVFRFRGKSGVENIIEVSNPTVAATIKQSVELPGYELFKFIDEEGNKHVVDSSDVNLFLKEVTNDDFTAKDFRTWGASDLSARNLYKLGEPEDSDVAKKNIVETIKSVAEQLNNTVAVCRSYYIHPTVIKTYTKKALIPVFDEYAKNRKNRRGLSWDEYALIKLLEKHPYRAA
jgi:DNA topoisomerase-1